MLRLLGMFAIIPATLLLAVSFFVLFTIRKIEAQGLKAFGYAIVTLVWLGALLVFSSGVYSMATGRSLSFCPMQKMMKDGASEMGQFHKQGMMHGRMPANMQQETQEEKK